MSILNLIALFYAFFTGFSPENKEVKKSVEFQKIVISTEFVSEGVCVGDINRMEIRTLLRVHFGMKHLPGLSINFLLKLGMTNH